MYTIARASSTSSYHTYSTCAHPKLFYVVHSGADESIRGG